MKEFLKKLTEFSVGPVIGAIIGLITVPITSYLVDPEQFGLTSMYNLANTILTLVILIGIDQAFMREYNEYEDKRKLILNSFLVPFANAIFIGIMLIIFQTPLAKLLFEDATMTRPIVLLAICSPLFMIEKFMLLSLRMKEKAIQYSSWSIISKLLNLILVVLLLLLYKRNFESIIYAGLLSQVIVSITLFIMNRREVTFSVKYIDIQQIKSLLKFGLPLIPATLIGWGLNSMDTIFLRSMTDYTQLGYYTVALKVVSVLTLVQTSFTTFWAPTAFKWKSQNVENRKFELVSEGITFGMSIILMGILIFKPLIPVILSKEYIEVIYILPFLLFHPIFYTMSETTTLGISFSKRTHYNIWVSVISMVVNLILNYILIPNYGAIGAAAATGVSYLTFFWCRTLISRKLWYKFPIKHFAIISCLLLIVTILNIVIRDIIVITLINIIITITIILIYKEFVRWIIKMKKKKIQLGLICYSTQKEQLINLLEADNKDILVVGEKKTKWKKLLNGLYILLKADIVYFGYGCTYMNGYLKIAKILHKKIICHWIGTDVVQARKNLSMVLKIQKYISLNLTCSPFLQRELAEIGITAEEVPILPANMETEFSSIPTVHKIMAYLPEGKEEFYGIKYIKKAAETFSNIEFNIVGNSKDSLGMPNVHFLGKIDKKAMNELYNDSTILIRLPKHDGLSLMLLEALIKGKEVIYCYDFPFTKKVANLDEIIEVLGEIVKDIPKLNIDGHNYIIEHYKLEECKNKISDYIEECLKNNGKESTNV